MDVQPWEAGRTLEKLIGGKFKKLGEYSRTEAERTFQKKLGNTREAGGTLEKLGQHSRSWGKTREAGGTRRARRYGALIATPMDLELVFPGCRGIVTRRTSRHPCASLYTDHLDHADFLHVFTKDGFRYPNTIRYTLHYITLQYITLY